MDGNFIRLILLILGLALVVGIWLWDRWQRGRDELPMVHFRDQDEDETLHEDDSADVDEQLLQTDFEPVTETTLYLDTDDDHMDEGSVDLDTDLAPASLLEDDSEPVNDDDEPQTPTLKHQPAWVQPNEPVIPAFVMFAASELLDQSEHAKSDEAEAPSTSAAAGPTAAAAKFKDVTVTGKSQPFERKEPSLVMAMDAEPEIPVLELAPEPAMTPRSVRNKIKEAAKPIPKPEAEPVNIRNEEDQIDLDLGFSAMDDRDLQEVSVDLPDLILQINIVSRSGEFSGEQILAAMDQVEMRAGEHNIYHRYDNQGKKKTLFSLASLVEPGSFPLKKMQTFSTPGLTLFTQLPGPRDGLLIYADMLYVAERLARLLDARLKDDSRSTLTKQTIEHTRGRIAEHKRQITLKLRQASEKQRGRR